MLSTIRRASTKKNKFHHSFSITLGKTGKLSLEYSFPQQTFLEIVGVDRVVLVDVHSGQIQGFLDPKFFLITSKLI